MNNLLSAGKPINMRVDHSGATLVESDVYNICERLREIDPALTVHVNPDGHHFPFSIQHKDKAGNEYLVCGVEALDARVIDKVNHMLRVPFEKRYAEAVRLEDKAREDADKEQWAKFYENMGKRMYWQLANDGFNNRVNTGQKSKRKQAAGR